MKARKALKRLRRVEELLSVVIDEFVGNGPRVRELLDSAKRSVIRAKAGINFESNPAAAKKPRKAKENKRSDLSARAGKAVAKKVSERKIRSREETHTTKRSFSTPPPTETPDRALAHEASPEPNQSRHAN